MPHKCFIICILNLNMYIYICVCVCTDICIDIHVYINVGLYLVFSRLVFYYVYSVAHLSIYVHAFSFVCHGWTDASISHNFVSKIYRNIPIMKYLCKQISIMNKH